MTFLAARLAEIRRHLDHLHEIRGRVRSIEDLLQDLSLHNDVLFSLVMIAQNVTDVAGELNSRRGLTFGTYREAIENLGRIKEFPREMIESLAELPGFRNVVLHEYVDLDFARVLAAMANLDPVERFVEIVGAMEMEE